MTNKSLRRRCKNCKERVTLKVVKIGNRIFLVCPKCLVKVPFRNQRKAVWCNGNTSAS